MKKFLLFVSTIIFSILIINNKIYAQEYPINPKPITYLTHSFEQENTYTYEYFVIYFVSTPIFEAINADDYFLINNINTVFNKGLDRNTNSYEYDGHIVLTSGVTEIYFRITVLKSIVDIEYSDDITPLFEHDTRIYIDYLDPTSVDYDRGFIDGYNRGFDDGYNNGYNEGRNTGYTDGYNTGYYAGYTDGTKTSQSEAYQQGYNDGARDSFQSKLHVWIVPAIIVVTVAGIFVGYRRERFGGD